MGMFDGSEFRAPNTNTVVPSLQNFLAYKDQEKQKQLNFEKDLMNRLEKLNEEKYAFIKHYNGVYESAKSTSRIYPLSK